MGQNYNQLSQEERVAIYHWHASGKSARWVGEALCRHHSAISRELKRNSKRTKVWSRGYEPIRAHGLALRRRQRPCRYKLARQGCRGPSALDSCGTRAPPAGQD
jgi:IS30 family transposase